MRRDSKKIIKFVSVAASCFYMISILSACGPSKPTAARQNIQTVNVVPAAVSSISTTVEYSSKLTPIQEIQVASKIAGKVTAVKADVGEKVQSGQVLFTLDASDLNAQLQQQQAALRYNEANLQKAEDSSIKQQLLQAQQTLQNAQIAYDNQKSSYDHNKELYDQGAISKQALDNEKQKLDNDVVALNSARDTVDLIKNKVGPQSVDAASAQVSQAQAGVNSASLQLQNSTITSPISGTVSVRNVDVGEMTNSSTPAYTVIDTKTMTAKVNVPDKMISKVKKGQTVPVKISALDNKSINGIVDSLSPAADSKTQMYEIKINIDNSDDSIKPGMFARVILPADKKDNVVTVPNETIKVEDGVSYIYTVDQGKVKKVAVTTGLSNDTITEISKGLEKDASVITEGQIFLNDGDEVRIAGAGGNQPGSQGQGTGTGKQRGSGKQGSTQKQGSGNWGSGARSNGTQGKDTQGGN
ncbi:MAG TPA: efflux RND transporter periplasmic adaptor subunit [Clostridia bacterium]